MSIEGERAPGLLERRAAPIGYRIVAAEQRGVKMKKKLESIRSMPIRCG
jgi:hypothetical protein